MSSNLGTLTVNLVAQTGNFTGAMDQAGRQSKRAAAQMAADAKKIETAFLVGLTVAAGAVTLFVKQSIDAADKARETAKAIGLGVEAYQALSFAASLSGVEQEAFARSISRLNVAMFDAASGASTQASYFQALGISVQDASGKMRSGEEVLLDLADVFQSLPDGVEKSAIAMKLFGRGGAEMIPLLNDGRAGITALMQQAERLGFVMGEKAASQADMFNDSLTVLSAVSKGFWNQVTAELLPSLNNLTQAFIQIADDGSAADGIASTLSNTLKLLASSAVGVAAVLQLASTSISGFVKVAAAAGITLSDLDSGLVGVSSKVVKNWDAIKEASKEADDQFNKTFESYGALLDKIQNPSQESADALSSQMKQQADLVKGVEESLKLQNEQERARQELMREGESLTESLRTETEVYNDELQRLNELLTSGAITQETFNRAQSELGTLGPSVQNFFNSFEKGFGTSLTQSSAQFFNDFAQRVGQATKQATTMFAATTTSIIFGQEKASEGFKKLGMAIAQTFVQLGIEMLAQRVIAMISTKLIGAAVGLTMGGIATAAAPAAALVSLASFGANAAPAAAGMTATAATASAIAAASALGGIPGAATGGNVTRAGSVLIGERGPEILNLPTGAQVVPLDRAPRNGGGVGAVNVKVYNNVSDEADASVSQKQGADGGVEIEVMIDRIVADNIRQGTNTFKAMRDQFGLRSQTSQR